MRKLLQVPSLMMAAVLVLLANRANANLPNEATHIVVKTADLDLSSAAGVATAKRRIEHAADQICGFDGNMLSLSGQCREQAIKHAELALKSQITAR